MPQGFVSKDGGHHSLLRMRQRKRSRQTGDDSLATVEKDKADSDLKTSLLPYRSPALTDSHKDSTFFTADAPSHILYTQLAVITLRSLQLVLVGERYRELVTSNHLADQDGAVSEEERHSLCAQFAQFARSKTLLRMHSAKKLAKWLIACCCCCCC